MGKIVTINGHKYDSATGMPIVDVVSAGSPSHSVNASSDIHRHTQKSQTLSRRFTKKPDLTTKPARSTRVRDNSIIRRHRTNQTTQTAAHVATSPLVSHFGQPQTKTVNQTPADVVKPKSTTVVKPTSTPAAPSITKTEAAKQRAISDAMRTIDQHQKANHTKRHRRTHHPIKASHKIILSVVSVCLIVPLIVATTISLVPSVAIIWANARSGINASYPTVLPEGYSQHGSIQYGHGFVDITFKSIKADSSISLHQEKSMTDSDALANNVTELTNNQYTTTEYKGLTVYTYRQGSIYTSTWVNGDIVYTLTSSSALTQDVVDDFIDGLQ